MKVGECCLLWGFRSGFGFDFGASGLFSRCRVLCLGVRLLCLVSLWSRVWVSVQVRSSFRVQCFTRPGIRSFR